MPYIPIYLRTDLEADPPQYQDNHYEAFGKVNSNMEAFDSALSGTVDAMSAEFEAMTERAIEQIRSQAVPYHTHYLQGPIDCGLVTDEETPITVGILNMDIDIIDGGTFV